MGFLQAELFQQTFPSENSSKTKHSPQLIKLIIIAKRLTIKAALAVLLQYFVSFDMIVLKRKVKAKECPKMRIKVICIVKIE